LVEVHHDIRLSTAASHYWQLLLTFARGDIVAVAPLRQALRSFGSYCPWDKGSSMVVGAGLMKLICPPRHFLLVRLSEVRK